MHSQTSGETPSNIVFLGGIPLNSKRESLQLYLNQFGQVTSLALPRYKPSGVLKGYAKASFKTVQQAEGFVNSQPHTIGGLDVGVSYWQEKDTYLANKDQQNERKVFVKFNPNALTADDLEAYFSQYGPIHAISIKSDIHTMRTKDYCYILFEEIYSARMSVQESPHNIRGFQTHCEMSQPAHITRQLRNQVDRTSTLPLSMSNSLSEYGSDYVNSEVRSRYTTQRSHVSRPYITNAQSSFQSNQFPSVPSQNLSQRLHTTAVSSQSLQQGYEFNTSNQETQQFSHHDVHFKPRVTPQVWNEEPNSPALRTSGYGRELLADPKLREKAPFSEASSPIRHLSSMSTSEQMFDFGRQLNSQKPLLKNKLSLELIEADGNSSRQALEVNQDADPLSSKAYFSAKRSNLSNTLGKVYAHRVATNHTSENLQFKVLRPNLFQAGRLPTPPSQRVY